MLEIQSLEKLIFSILLKSVYIEEKSLYMDVKYVPEPLDGTNVLTLVRL